MSLVASLIGIFVFVTGRSSLWSNVTNRPSEFEATPGAASSGKPITELKTSTSVVPQVGPRKASSLSASSLDKYAGVYSNSDASLHFTLLRRGDGLVARLTGQPFYPLFASGPDELFFEIADTRLSILRNASGQVYGLIHRRQGSNNSFVRDAVPVPHIEFPDASVIAGYVGDYDFGRHKHGAKISVFIRGEMLFAQLTNQEAYPLFSVGKDQFEYDVVAAALEFERDASGRVVALALHQNNLKMKAPRLQ